jgi:hypothetical protein
MGPVDDSVTTNSKSQSHKSLKSKVGLAAAKAAALRVNLNVQGDDRPFIVLTETPVA